MKKIASIVLALVLVLAMAAPAMAATITIASTADKPIAGHTYEVYQIFTGTLSAGEKLSDIKYGQNYTPNETKVGDSVPTDDLEAITDARAFADSLVDGDLLEGDPVATLNDTNGFTTTDLANGYYLILDVTEELPEGDSLSAYMVQVIETVTINPKSGTIESDKKIASDDYEDNNAGDDSVTTDGKNNNGAVGSTVNFELTVKVPANAANYTYYYCVLNDALSEGLTFNASSVTVKVDEKTLEKGTDYILYDNTDTDTTNDADAGLTFQIAMLDAKSLAGKTITVIYSATINEDAIIGVEGNPNKFDVTYSNDPNYDYDDKNNNGKPDDAEDIPTGETPEKTTHTYVTGVELIKVDENGNVLTGAEFTISGDSIKYVLVSEETFAPAEDGKYWKLANGNYTTEAPRTADEYIEKTDDRTGGYVKNTDGTYSVATDEQLADETITLYEQLKANGDSYADTDTKYAKTVTYKVVGDEESETNVSAYVGADGVLYFNGLGEGIYTITETKTPTGYNTINDITLKIKWTAPENYPTNTECQWTYEWSGGATGNGNTITIENVSGKILPETGGIGTTIFYVAGGLLMVGALVLLITKRKVESK